jgi:cellulose synthase/poly-beta-1,6-N-acetylglucosamine synthase-like glycosyltransferase
MDYLKIGKAEELTGHDRKIYRCLETLPGLFSWVTLLSLLLLSYFFPVFVAFFIIAFDIYWLLLVIYLSIILLSAYFQLKKNIKTNWLEKCQGLKPINVVSNNNENKEIVWSDIIHLIILPIYKENLEIIRSTLNSIVKSDYSMDKIFVAISIEERAGAEALKNIDIIKLEYNNKFGQLYITIHPDGIEKELKGKGSNQCWAAKEVKKKIIDKEGIDYDKILVSVFDIDTVIYKDFFYCLTHKFFTCPNPYRASYQPIPVYHNNIWQAPFFARVAASSNTFWQMMQQIRQEKLATYSSHSMTWRALVEIGFWSTTMVSEDSRIFWHCFCYYKGDYRVEPLHYPVSMDVCMDETMWQTAKNLYKQQRRWGWGVENVPYLIFNTIKMRKQLPIKKMIDKIFIQLYGFHSWATNALIIGVIGWMPMLLGGDRFNVSVLSTNLPVVTRSLMIIAMSGLVLSSILSTLLLPPKPPKLNFLNYIIMPLQWIILPITIIIFGSIPGLDAQTRMMFGKYLGFWVTPKSR